MQNEVKATNIKAKESFMPREYRALMIQKESETIGKHMGKPLWGNYLIIKAFYYQIVEGSFRFLGSEFGSRE